MNRLTTPIFCVVVSTAVGQKRPSPDVARLSAVYRGLNAAYKQNSVKDAKAWFVANLAPDFKYTSKQKIIFDRAKFLSGIDDQFRQVKSVSDSTMKVVSVKGGPERFTVVVTGKFEAVVAFDGAPLLMTDASESIDTWVKSGKSYTLVSSVVTKEDVQMRQRK